MHGQHKAGPVNWLRDGLHGTEAVDWLQLTMCLHAMKGAPMGSK